MSDAKRLGLEPVSKEELEEFYGCNGHGISCSEAGKTTDKVNSECCWHDCEQNGKATKLWTAWG